MAVTVPGLPPAGTGTPGDQAPASTSTAGVTRSLVRMTLTLWKAQYRHNVGGTIGAVVGTVYGLGTIAMLVVILVIGAFATPDTVLVIMLAVGALPILAWTIVPLLAFGVTDRLDVRKLALLPLDGRRLRPAMLAAAACSIPSALTLLAYLGLAVAATIALARSDGGIGLRVPGIVLALLGAVAGWIVCIMIPRVITALTSTRRTSRRRRELSQVIGVVVMLGAIYAVNIVFTSNLEQGIEFGLPQLEAAAHVVAWTPFAAPVALGVTLGTGLVWPALVSLAWLIVIPLVLWRLWGPAIDRGLESAALTSRTEGAVTTRGRFVYRFLPGSPVGVVAARCLQYWRRDSRYLSNALVFGVVSVFLVAMGIAVPESRYLPIMGAYFSCLTGIAIANDLGLDGGALWLHIVSGVDARSDVLGRELATAVIGAPFQLLMGIAVPFVIGDPALIPTVLLAMLGLVPASLGCSMLAAVLVPYRAKAPGTNAMKSQSSMSINSFVSSLIAVFGQAVPLVPAGILGIIAAVTGTFPLWPAALLCAVLGLLVLWLTNRMSIARLRSHQVRIFQSVKAWE